MKNIQHRRNSRSRRSDERFNRAIIAEGVRTTVKLRENSVAVVEVMRDANAIALAFYSSNGVNDGVIAVNALNISEREIVLFITNVKVKRTFLSFEMMSL